MTENRSLVELVLEYVQIIIQNYYRKSIRVF